MEERIIGSWEEERIIDSEEVEYIIDSWEEERIIGSWEEGRIMNSKKVLCINEHDPSYHMLGTVIEQFPSEDCRNVLVQYGKKKLEFHNSSYGTVAPKETCYWQTTDDLVVLR